MALRYEFAWDFSRVGAVAVKVTDAATFEVIISTGTYAHTTLASVDANYTAFAAALQSALNTGSGGARTYTVSYTAPSIWYKIDATGGSFSLSFSTTTVAANGVRMRQLLGFNGNVSSTTSASSNVRPYYVLVPVTAGRSDVSDDYEPDDLVQEVVADSGTSYATAPTITPKYVDWQQVGDQDAPSTAYTISGLGSPVHKRITATVPWSYEHAYEHHRTGFDPILVVDGGTSENLVCRMRGSKSSFHPKRMGGADYDLWSVPFGVRLLGRF